MAEKNTSCEREAIFAEEAFVVDVQILLDQIMKEKSITKAELARAMNVSRARISQIFSDDCKNLTVRLLARAMFAMGEIPEITCEMHLTKLQRKWEAESSKLARAASNVVQIWDEESSAMDLCGPANDNRAAGLARHYRPRAAA